MAEPARRMLSYRDYLDLERETGIRHEYLDGEVWAMAGGTLRHSRVKTKLTIAIGNALGDGPCQPYDSDLKIRIPETGLATYPDLAIICGPPVVDVEDHNAATNPTVLVEVLSKDTEAWDRGGKFLHYRRLDSLQHTLLVSQDAALIELFTRMDDGTWRLSEHGPGQQVALPAIDVAIEVDAVFSDLPEG